MRHLRLEGLDRSIAFSPNAADVEAGLRSILIGWPQDQRPADAEIVVERRRGKVVVTRPSMGLRLVEPSVTSGVCSLVIEIVDMLIAAKPDFGCLHAGAAEYDGRLVLFPATHRAGKSTLMARLAHAGRRIFADDLIPVDLTSGEGVASGCLPRPRLPLPAAPRPGFRDWVKAHTVLSDGYYAYVGGPAARHGERRPVGAIVLLERQDRPCAPQLSEAKIEDALLATLSSNTMRDETNLQSFDRYLEVVRSCRAYRLRYCGLDDAAEALEAAFDPFPAPAPPSFGETRTVHEALPPAPTAGQIRYARHGAVQMNAVGGSAFLLRPDGEIFMLDPVGRGVWNALAEPQDIDSLTAAFELAFPEVDRSRLRRDVAALVGQLAERELIRVAD